MPITKIEADGARAWGLWKIDESEQALCELAGSDERIPNHIHHPLKRKEFITGRLLARELVITLGMTYSGLTKNDFGKPLLKSGTGEVSLTHSFPLVAAIVSTGKPVGIDLEQINPKLLRIAARVFHVTELRDAGSDLIKLTVYWCGKETLMKIYGKTDAIFAEHLRLEPFTLQAAGTAVGRILVPGYEATVNLHYQVVDNVVVMYNF